MDKNFFDAAFPEGPKQWAKGWESSKQRNPIQSALTLLGNFNLSRSPNAFSPEVELDASGIYIEESEWAQFFYFFYFGIKSPPKNTLPNTDMESKNDPVKNETSLQTIHLKFHVRFCQHVRGHASSPPTKTTSSKFKQWVSYTRNHIIQP